MRLSTVSERLRYARKLRGLSARKLSLLAGLSPSHVGQIERETSGDPGTATIGALARALDCEPAWLLYGVGVGPRGAAKVA